MLLSPGEATVTHRFRAHLMRGSHRPATEGSKTTACACCSARCCITGLANAVGGKQKPNARAVSPGTRATSCAKKSTPADPSHAYLVKNGSLLPAPCAVAGMRWADTGEATRSILNSPKERPQLCKYVRAETHKFVSPWSCDAVGFHVSLGWNPSQSQPKFLSPLQVKESAKQVVNRRIPSPPFSKVMHDREVIYVRDHLCPGESTRELFT